ncbi:hypothetical protein ISCGN_013618 [Ixodes scapularis]
MSGTHPSPSALATTERLYPPEEIVCHLCDKRLTSCISLGEHYEHVHSCHFVWRCSHCLAKTYTESTSMSSHYTRCRKKPLVSPTSTVVTNADSHSAAGNELPQAPTPSPASHTEEKEHPEFSRDSERADMSMPFTTGTPALRLPPAGDWTTEDVRTLAVQELSMPAKMKFVNKELAKGGTTAISARFLRPADGHTLITPHHAKTTAVKREVHTSFSNPGQRNTRRYKEILETLKAAAHKQPVPIQPVRVHDAGSARVHPQPAPGSPVTIAHGLLDPIKIGEDLGRGGINNARLEEATSNRPAWMAEVNIITNHFNVSSMKNGGTEGSKKKKRRSAKNRNQRRRERYAEHQRLYSLGPKVLVDEMRLDWADPAVLLGELHRVYDLLMSTPSRPVDGFITSEPVLNVEVEPFTDGELQGVLKNTDAKTAAGPDSLTLKKVAKTVFIPKSRSTTTGGDFRPITISSILLRIYTGALLRRFAQYHVFHNLQGGFGDDRSTSSNIIILQALMKARKQA